MTHQQRILKRSLNLKFFRDNFPSNSPYFQPSFNFNHHHYELFFHFFEGKLSIAWFKRIGEANTLVEAFLDTTLEFLHDKSLKEISQLSSREIENYLRDSNDVPVTQDQILLEELDKLLEKVKNYVYNLARAKTNGSTSNVSVVGFKNLKLVDQIFAVEAILDRFIRPTLLLDQGNIELLAIEDQSLVLSFQGACGTCPSSTAGTLDFVIRTLRSELNEESLIVLLEN